MLSRLLIIEAVAGLDAVEIPDHPIRCHGRIETECNGSGPHWLPPAPNCFYVDPDRLRVFKADPHGEPIIVGDLEVILFGSEFATRFARQHKAEVTFKGSDVECLAVCLEDDTQIDLPVEKARAALLRGEPITLTRDVLRYAIERAVETVGKRRRFRKGETLQRLFGEVS